MDKATSSKMDGMYFGLDLDAWNVILLVLLFATALAAFGLCVAQRAVNVLQNEIARNSENELEKYKSAAAQKISEANSRGEEAKAEASRAKLELEKLRQQFAGRRLSETQASSLVAFLQENRSRIAVISVTKLGDMEASLYADDFIRAFERAGVQINLKTIGLMSPPQYGVIISNASDGVLPKAFSEAGIAALVAAPTSGRSPEILIGLRPTPF